MRQQSPSSWEGFHIQPQVIELRDVFVLTRIPLREVNPHDMATKENNGEYLFTDVDMDGGVDVKMERVVVPPIEDMVMVDVNEGVNNAI